MAEKSKHLNKSKLLKYQKSPLEFPEGPERFDILITKYYKNGRMRCVRKKCTEKH